jgi:hypothetical protein
MNIVIHVHHGTIRIYAIARTSIDIMHIITKNYQVVVNISEY